MIKIKCALAINDKMNPGHLNWNFIVYIPF